MPDLRTICCHASALVVMAVAAPATVAGVMKLNTLTKPPTKTSSSKIEFTPTKPKARPRVRKRRRGNTPKPSGKRSGPKAPPIAPPLGGAAGGAPGGVEIAVEGTDIAPLPTAGLADEAAEAMAKNVIETAESVDAQPELIGDLNLNVPDDIAARRLRGRVEVKFVIRADGRVTDVQIVLSDPEGVYDAVVRQAILTARFRPATRDGRPVDMLALVPITFNP